MSLSSWRLRKKIDGDSTIKLRFNNGTVDEVTGFKFEEGTAWADPNY